MDPYREAVHLNLTFIWGDRETEDRAKVSIPPLFLKDCRSIISKHRAFNRDQMHGNTNTTKNKKTKFTSQERRMTRDYW